MLMTKNFISYNRHSENVAKTLANDIEALGHTVWFDQELSGGQAWWDQILAKIRDCDVFVFILDPESLKSTACKREYGYAADLGKPILPVLVSKEVSTNLLPPALSQIQFVDYRDLDRDAAFCLARSYTTISPHKPLPDPLPDSPDVPISYLGNLTVRVETASTLSYEEQSALVVDLKRSLRDPETVDDAHTLLVRLRKRRDLLAAIADEIDELLSGTKEISSIEFDSQNTQKVRETIINNQLKPEKEISPAKTIQSSTAKAAGTALSPTITPRKRLKYAMVGAILGTIIGVAAMLTYHGASWVFGFLTGAGGAITGAITGKRLRQIIPALIGAALGWIIVAMIFMGEGPIAAGGVFGAPSGAILVAISGVIFQKLKKRSKSK